MSNIQKGNNQLFVEEDGETVAKITYVTDGSILTVDHTIVSEKKRGSGLGQELVKELVEQARNNHQKIKPVCSYAKKQFEKHPEYQDVLAN